MTRQYHGESLTVKAPTRKVDNAQLSFQHGIAHFFGFALAYIKVVLFNVYTTLISLL